MPKIKILFIQEKKVKKGAISLSDLIENEVPDTYEFEHVNAKEDIISKVAEFSPQIVFISNSKAYDIFELVQRIKGLDSEIVILAMVFTDFDSEREMMDRLTDLGAYKCYTSQLSVDSLIHDMFVSLNME
ncbi:MAG: hypothetical protein LUF29_06050 [Oscillospiraceae bacterium]|nr:hypothetical protein [Oscillospiraceae bacterium]